MQDEVSYIIISSVKVPKSDQDYDLRVPKDMAYIFSGAYITLSCKLVEQVRKATRDWSNLTDQLFNVCPCFLLLSSAGAGKRRVDGARRNHKAAKRPRIFYSRLGHSHMMMGFFSPACQGKGNAERFLFL